MKGRGDHDQRNAGADAERGNDPGDPGKEKEEMNRDGIRKETCIIIRKHGHYLRGVNRLTNREEWSWSAYEAWKTRDREEAERVARRTGGVMVLFNPIVNQRRVIGT